MEKKGEKKAAFQKDEKEEKEEDASINQTHANPPGRQKLQSVREVPQHCLDNSHKAQSTKQSRRITYPGHCEICKDRTEIGI